MPTVINHYTTAIPDGAIWIMRGKSCLANKWTHLPTERTKAAYRCADREEAVEKFTVWLRRKVFDERDELILEAMGAIKEDSVLVCCCYPKLCHGTIIIEVWRELKAKPVVE